jgi:hypothetical protein
MPEQAESAMIRAAFRVIDGDTRVQAKYSTRRLMEIGTKFNASDVGFLGVSGLPVKPVDKPSSSENIFVDIWIFPTLANEETTRDSKLEMTDEFNEFRKLLTSNTPLRDENGDPVSDDFVDIDFRKVDYSVQGIRRPYFVARYSDKIDPTTGSRVG